MNKLFFFLFASVNALCCDICNMNVSLIPEDNKNILSLNYRSRINSGKYSMYGNILPQNNGVRHTGPGDNSTIHFGKSVTEIFRVMDIKGVYYWNQKLGFIGSLPLINNQQRMDGASHVNLTSIGDPITLVQYELYNSKRARSTSSIAYKWMIGGGIKYPLGNYQLKQNNLPVELDLQPGTGSLDYLITSDYTFSYKKVGLIINTNYKINTTNKLNYRYGNSWNQMMHMFYTIQATKNTRIMPVLGINYESANQDYKNKRLIVQSGGEVALASVGINLYLNRMRIDFTYQKAMYNNMGGTTQLNTNERWLAGILFFIN